ncbi:MAG: DNA-binding domain-containing protein [Pseudomonadota bacterium]|nr:DNA-binding domain-containing protein [Pseudomonadota bacterium]
MLRDLQLDFVRQLLGEADTGLAAQIRAHGLTGGRRLNVYRNNTFISLTEALKAVYPVILRLVGDGFFGYAADQYIRRHPSASGNLHDFGDRWGEFLRGFGPAAGLPYLPDVAALEWAYHRAFHAADHPPLDLAALAAVPVQRHADLTFRLHPSARLLASPYPILRIWQANQPDQDDAPPVDLAEGGVRLLVIRRRLEVTFEPLPEGEWTLLAVLAGGGGFAAACGQALAAQPGFDLPASFRRHVLEGTLAAFALTDNMETA